MDKQRKQFNKMAKTKTKKITIFARMDPEQVGRIDSSAERNLRDRSDAIRLMLDYLDRNGLMDEALNPNAVNNNKPQGETK